MLQAYRELDDALGLSAMAANGLADAQTGRNGRHALVGLLRRASGVRDLRRLAAALNNRGVQTARGGRWHVSNVQNLVDRL